MTDLKSGVDMTTVRAASTVWPMRKNFTDRDVYSIWEFIRTPWPSLVLTQKTLTPR